MNIQKLFSLLTILCVHLSFNSNCQALIKRCFECRSRGELGSCKDPFLFNITMADGKVDPGVTTMPCSSGWCGKILEETSINNEHGEATSRMCLQRGPDDREERCARIVKNYKPVFMCFCKGDLCNHSTTITTSIYLLIGMSLFIMIW